MQQGIFAFVQETVAGRCMSLQRRCQKCLRCSTDLQPVHSQRKVLVLNQSPDASLGHLVDFSSPSESDNKTI